MPKLLLKLLTRKSLTRLVLITFTLTFLAQAAMARQSVSQVSATKVQTQTMRVQSPAKSGNELSRDFQHALESGNARTATMICGLACQPGPPSGRISAGNQEPIPAYICNGGNCACAGAADCVDMNTICMAGTIGCNDYGCTCKEAPPPPDDP